MTNTTGSQNEMSRRDDVVISIDAMGGDAGPAAIIGGMAKSAGKNDRIRFILHGDGPKLEAALRRKPHLAARTLVRHCDHAISMDERPSTALRKAKGTSMLSTLQAVADGEATVAVSAGNTGALMAMSMMVLRKLPGVHRPAIAIMWPSRSATGQTVMLDVGADIRADAEDLLKYAIMGASYARNGLGIARPRVGLLNVGTEPHKGRSELHEASDLITAAADRSDFDYIGYVEGTDIPSGRVDIVVTDGFTGNVALKTGEGTAQLIRTLLKEAFAHSILSRIGALFALTSLRRLSKRIDPRRGNGGVFLGLNGTVVKSHGRADAISTSAAIKLAFKLAESGFGQRLAARVAAGLAERPRNGADQPTGTNA